MEHKYFCKVHYEGQRNKSPDRFSVLGLWRQSFSFISRVTECDKRQTLLIIKENTSPVQKDAPCSLTHACIHTYNPRTLGETTSNLPLTYRVETILLSHHQGHHRLGAPESLIYSPLPSLIQLFNAIRLCLKDREV